MSSPTPMYALAASARSQWLATVGNKGGHVWDTETGRRLADLPNGKSARSIIFADGDQRIHVGEPDGALATWEWTRGVATGPRRISSDDGDIVGLAVRGRRLFLAHGNRVVTEVDDPSGREVRRFTTSSSPFSIAVSPDATTLAAGTFTGTVFLWDLTTGAATELKGQTRLVNGVDFSPDGRMLASASRDGTTRLWDVATGNWLATIGSRTPGAERVRFFPDGWRIAIAYEDGDIEIRNIQYFFRYAAGHAEYQLRLFRDKGESFPRAGQVLEWARGILSGPSAPRP
jgi:WD40 repeat protein